MHDHLTKLCPHVGSRWPRSRPLRSEMEYFAVIQRKGYVLNPLRLLVRGFLARVRKKPWLRLVVLARRRLRGEMLQGVEENTLFHYMLEVLYQDSDAIPPPIPVRACRPTVQDGGWWQVVRCTRGNWMLRASFPPSSMFTSELYLKFLVAENNVTNEGPGNSA